MQTQRVVFTGAVLARLYTACAEATASFDGVLFGKTRTNAPTFCLSHHRLRQAAARRMPKMSTTMHKARSHPCHIITLSQRSYAEAVCHEETVLVVTNVILSASACSFYDGSGKVNCMGRGPSPCGENCVQIRSWRPWLSNAAIR